MNQLYVCVETVSVETNDALAILHFTVKNFHEWVPVNQPVDIFII